MVDTNLNQNAEQDFPYKIIIKLLTLKSKKKPQRLTYFLKYEQLTMLKFGTQIIM